MQGCWEPNLKLREAERLFEDQIVGPESIANIGGSVSASAFCFCFWLWLNWQMFVTCVCRCFILRNSWREDCEAGRSKTLYSDETWKTALWWERRRNKCLYVTGLCWLDLFAGFICYLVFNLIAVLLWFCPLNISLQPFSLVSLLTTVGFLHCCHILVWTV